LNPYVVAVVLLSQQDYLLEKWKNEETRVNWNKKTVESFSLSNKAKSLHLSDGVVNIHLFLLYISFFIFFVDFFCTVVLIYLLSSSFFLQLYFPSVYDDHWFVFLVDMKYQNFIFLDSFYSGESTNQAVITRGIGLGVIFVHIFTESDIESNCW
jgi:hypothetical protein